MSWPEVRLHKLERKCMIMGYRKHWRTKHTSLLKIFLSNRGCGLSSRTSGHHAVHLHKLRLFSENFTVCIDLCSKVIRSHRTHVHIDHWLLRVWWLSCIKPSSIKELLSGLTLPLLSSWTSLSKESPYRHEVVSCVADGRRLFCHQNQACLVTKLWTNELKRSCCSRCCRM